MTHEPSDFAELRAEAKDAERDTEKNFRRLIEAR